MNALAPAHPIHAKLLPAIWKLLAMRLRLTFNGFKHGKLRRKIGMVVISLLILGFAYLIFSASRGLLNFIHSPEFPRYVGVDLRPFLESIPALMLTSLFIGTLLTSFGVLLQALYLSGDMDFLKDRALAAKPKAGEQCTD